MSDATNANMPNPGVPFLDASGRITQVWWAFLLSLFQRTGRSGSGPAPSLTLDDVFAIETVSPQITPVDAQSILIALEQLMTLVAAQGQRGSMTEMTFAGV
jgi:hypothetical protein